LDGDDDVDDQVELLNVTQEAAKSFLDLGSFVGDAIINAFVDLLQPSVAQDTVLAYSEVWVRGIEADFAVNSSRRRYLDRLLKRAAGTTRLLVPANVDDNHWVMLEVTLVPEAARLIRVFDSSSPAAVNPRYNALLARFCRFVFNEPPDAPACAVLHGPTVRQLATDCGVFTMLNMAARVTNVFLDATALTGHVPYAAAIFAVRWKIERAIRGALCDVPELLALVRDSGE
jgi:hypothetical protein